ncbi:hypothetical protein GC1_14080 [Leisingera sp. ANG1]|nr:hypothetical protein RA23_03460 [Leisingera sp. ANG-S3]KID08294.1 hypothetical protein GC1_14080 [Leisingera sp. ANG1]
MNQFRKFKMTEFSTALAKGKNAGTPSVRGKPQVHNIQYLRAIAAMGVVVFHAGSVLRAGNISFEPLAFGASGVDLFFIISGFVMVYTTHDQMTAREFAAKRMIRVVPVYYLITLLVFAISIAAPSLLQATTSDPVQLIKSLLFIPFEKSNGLVQPIVFVGWTLNYEMAFYALFAASLLLPAHRTAFVLAVLAAAVCLHPFSNGTLAAFYTSPILLEFAAGMILALIWRGRRNRRTGVLLVCAGIGAVILLAQIPGLHRSLLYGLPYLALTAGVLLLEGSIRHNRILALLGEASYSIYLTHFFVTQFFAKIIKGLDAGPGLALIAFAASIIAAAAAGVLFHKIVEAPVTRSLSGTRSKKDKARRSAAV